MAGKQPVVTKTNQLAMLGSGAEEEWAGDKRPWEIKYYSYYGNNTKENPLHCTTYIIYVILSIVKENINEHKYEMLNKILVI